ncbi:hypothetical protein TWF192_009838 [Orbilia oligospora]|uniref:F-box domain-containing protein n=1 Tax=Orbilia oligospora TaxID=2813651 RepID=A0A6G1MIY1_ORBOL|nr:hypothetical protein TWF679_005418 [Orbilia oligospora]KAF3230326.1 hypothetical protein TWF191_010212 [Orbilia oligospora]KAF3260557.1 hypothetical protein TWF192_009838 [Orbilia oligospora]
MHPFDKLSNELLLQIFESLPYSDAAVCALVCKRLHNIFSRTQIEDYTVKVDHPSHRAWKLIRCLLVNPKLGERFKKLSFTYHPRRCDYPQTWTLQWYWTTEEETQLEHLCQNWDISAAFKWIRDGIYGNSISHSCFVTLPTSKVSTSGTDLTVWDGCCGRDFLSTFKSHREENYFDIYYREDLEGGYDDYWKPCLRFSATMDQCISRLSNLREFTFWGLELGDVCENCPEREMVEFVLKVLLLPRLEVARVGRRWCFDKWGVKAAMSTIGNSGPGKSRPTKMVPADGRSGIKHLELRYEQLEKGRLEMFAKFTRKLESLELVLGRYATMEEGEIVAGFFLENNKETLARGRVIVRAGDTDDFPDPWRDRDDLGLAHYFDEDE